MASKMVVLPAPFCPEIDHRVASSKSNRMGLSAAVVP